LIGQVLLTCRCAQYASQLTGLLVVVAELAVELLHLPLDLVHCLTVLVRAF
jgi:hypothetical protein